MKVEVEISEGVGCLAWKNNHWVRCQLLNTSDVEDFCNYLGKPTGFSGEKHPDCPSLKEKQCKP
ncbi:MAG: hypothetical protein KAR06_04815 [Deltaproteobacteria bacterium]|nr:hypothetical protein [Deltaproteobacteria bacterium]